MTASSLSFPPSYSFLLWWPSSSAAALLPKDNGEAKSEAAIKRPCLVYLFSVEITAGVLQIFLSSVLTPPTVIQMMRVKYPPRPLSPPTIFKTGTSHAAATCRLTLHSLNKQQKGYFPIHRELLDMIYVMPCQKAKRQKALTSFRTLWRLSALRFGAIFIPTCHVLLNGGRALVPSM